MPHSVSLVRHTSRRHEHDLCHAGSLHVLRDLCVSGNYSCGVPVRVPVVYLYLHIYMHVYMYMYLYL